MSDFSRGLLSGLAGSNGIAGAVRNFTLAPYAAAIQAQRAKSYAAEQALAEAKLQDIQNRRTANNYWAEQAGVPAEALNGYSPAEVEQIMKNTRIGKMMQASGMLQPRGDGLDDIRASVNNNIARDEAALKRLAQDSALIGKAANGGEIYRYQNNGAAFNPFDGTVMVTDPDVRSLYRQEKQAAITQKRARAAKAARSSGNGRGSSSNAGWQIKQTEDGETVRVNARTGEIVPLGRKLKFGKKSDDFGFGGDSDSAEMKEYREVRARAKARGDDATVRALDDAARAIGLI